MSTPTRPRPWAPAALALSLLGLGIGQGVAVVTAGPSGPPVVLRLALEEGDLFRYRMGMTMDGRVSAGLVNEPIRVTTSSLAEWRVVEVDAAGAATIEVRTRVESATANGRPVAPAAVAGEETATMRVAPDGRILTAEAGLASQPGAPAPVPGVSQLFPTFPPNAVAPGDRWRAAYTQRFLEEGPGVRVVTRSEFERYEEIQGVEAAVIRSAVSVPLDVSVPFEDLQEASGGGTVDPGLAGASTRFHGSAEMEARTWFDPTRGIQVRSEIEGAVDIRLAIRDLPPDASPPPVTSTEMEFELALTMELLQGPS
jgi:hypothetical protein